MEYKKIKAHKLSEEELRRIWSDCYCRKPIQTFDQIEVSFYATMFDHCFFESANRLKKDKSILSYNRLERIYWIKDALEDPDSIRKVGWDSNKRKYDVTRRVALVKDNYLVVILIYAEKKARFITAYEIDNAENLDKILRSPDWT